MQRATCTNIRIRSPADARVVFHAVLLNILPMVTRRLDAEERALIIPGSVYVWEERGPHAELTGVSYLINDSSLIPDFRSTGWYRAVDGWYDASTTEHL